MRRALPTLVAITALTLAGCGSDEGEGSSEGSGATESAVEVTCEEPPAAPTDPLSFSPEDLPEPMGEDPATVMATIGTNCGDIEIELLAADAPQTVASFEFLSQEGYWENSPCHRLTTSGLFVLQCGDPTATGGGNPGYGYGIENAPETGMYPAGTLAMARTPDPESNGGQFFVVYEETMLPVEGGGYSIFGQVTGGLEIVQAIAEEGTDGGATDGPPAQPISILSVTVDS